MNLNSEEDQNRSFKNESFMKDIDNKIQDKKRLIKSNFLPTLNLTPSLSK